MPCLLAIWHYFVELICFDQALYDFLRGAWLLVDIESHLRIGLSYDISELVRHCQFFLANPLLDKVHFTRLDNWSHKLNRFNLIQCCWIDESIEVNDKWWWTSSARQLFELVDCFLVSKKSSWSILGNLSSTCIVLSSNLLVEHKHKQVISSRQWESLG